MGERSAYPPGTFCWVDLGTTDVEAAKAFYGALFGWEATDLPAGDDRTYTTFTKDGLLVAGAFAHGEAEAAAGVGPNWLSYVSVQDAAAAAAQAGEAGGSVITEPLEVGESGRLAVVQDPGGGVFGLWEAKQHFGAALVNGPGALSWNELAARDPEPAQAFYAALFGWTLQPMEGSPDEYWVIMNGERANGGIGRPAEELGPIGHDFWSPFFGAPEGVEAAAARVAELGGEVVIEPHHLPVGGFAAVLDGQGAGFFLYEGEYDD